MPKRGQIVELVVDSAAYEGVSVARLEGLVVFVRNAVPGDRVRALIRRKKKTYAEATVEEVLQPSTSRVEPRCPYFGVCGGCRWQNVDYSRQLEFKQQQVEDLFSRIGQLDSPEVRPTLASPNSYYYRNKMEFTFGTHRWLRKEEIESGRELSKGFALGLHVPRRFDRILDLETCYLQSALSAQIVNAFRALALKHKWSAYDSRKHEGYLRNLVIRSGQQTGEIMVNLVTSRNEGARMEVAKEVLLAAFPGITTLVNSVNPTRSPVAGGEERVYHGDGSITEQIAHLRFRIAPTVFFQPNTGQAERLYAIIRDLADLKGGETVYDLYSGVGCISLFLAPTAKRVVGVESGQAAVETARQSAAENGITNCVFHAGDALEGLGAGMIERYGSPDLAVVDPPRPGLDRKMCQAILEAAPPRLLYVSCNPATQARDLKLLAPGYRVEVIQPIDMFPHTHHIETVVRLARLQGGLGVG
ncbi:MAG: 23S rRNA (uracil(1939)-C(5))-methyltransferase RlmD [Acidobacteriota bacterium]